MFSNLVLCWCILCTLSVVFFTRVIIILQNYICQIFLWFPWFILTTITCLISFYMASFYFLMLLYLSFLHLLFTTITIWVIMNLCPLTTLSVSFLEFLENVQYLKNMDNSPELIKIILENPALDVQRVDHRKFQI